MDCFCVTGHSFLRSSAKHNQAKGGREGGQARVSDEEQMSERGSVGGLVVGDGVEMLRALKQPRRLWPWHSDVTYCH